MKRLYAMILAMGLAVGLLAGPAPAQGAAEGYSKMSVRAGLMTGNLNTRRPEEFSGGVEIELISEDGTKPNLPIKADVITFTWKEGRSTPVTIKMRGNVDINHPDAHIVSQRADWDLESGDIVFTGNPVLDSEDFQGLSADQIRINMETGAYELDNGVVQEMALQGAEHGAPVGGLPGLLAESDVTDWASLLNTIKAQSGEAGDNPGKQILAQLDEGTRNVLLNTSTEALMESRGLLLDRLNGVLRRPGMFKRSAWADTELSDDIEALLDIADQTPAQQVRQNRLLLHAAYPEMVKGL